MYNVQKKHVINRLTLMKVTDVKYLEQLFYRRVTERMNMAFTV